MDAELLARQRWSRLRWEATARGAYRPDWADLSPEVQCRLVAEERRLVDLLDGPVTVTVPLADLTTLHAMARTVPGVNEHGRGVLGRVKAVIDTGWQSQSPTSGSTP